MTTPARTDAGQRTCSSGPKFASMILPINQRRKWNEKLRASEITPGSIDMPPRKPCSIYSRKTRQVFHGRLSWEDRSEFGVGLVPGWYPVGTRERGGVDASLLSSFGRFLSASESWGFERTRGLWWGEASTDMTSAAWGRQLACPCPPPADLFPVLVQDFPVSFPTRIARWTRELDSSSTSLSFPATSRL
jgi:hypothetical protein